MINVKRYIINYTKHVTQRIPVEFRFADVTAYLMVLAGPFISIYNSLLSFRDQIIYKLTITPQVVYLEKMLNDRYDTVQRRIYIMDGQEYAQLFIYMAAELKPLFIYTKAEVAKPKNYLYVKGEVGQGTFDFVVFVPNDVAFDPNEIASLINTYKLASKTYNIQTF